MTDHLYLAHHGIKGMKWGVRRFRDKDGSLTSAGKKRYSKKIRREKKITKYEQKYREKGLDEDVARAKAEAKYKRRRAALAIGVAVVAAYATYKFIDSGHAHQMALEGQSIVNRMLRKDATIFKTNDKLRSASGVDEIMSTVVSRINPEYGQPGTKNNCRRCTFAYEMSRRGYDVRATRTIKGTGQSVGGFGRAVNKRFSLVSIFKEAGDVSDVEYMDRLTSALGRAGAPVIEASSPFNLLRDYPNGARGELGMRWTVGGAHSMAWEIIDGSPVIFDCQTGRKYSSVEDFGPLATLVEAYTANRLDNVDLDTRFLERWLTNA